MTPEKKVEPAPLVPPFVRFVASAIPMVFDDSLSYYECLAALTKYMQDVADVVNNNGAVTEEYIQMTKDMKSYMDNYFENLNVQEEINKKLDQMAQDGSFQPLLDITFADYYDRLQAYTDSQLDSKVDKDGTGQITVNNLSQSVKEMMTGGSVAVVGINSVGTENIIDASINYQKLSDNGKNGAAGYAQKKILNLNWEQGSRHNNWTLQPSTNTIVITEPITLSPGMEIKINEGYVGIVYWNDEGTIRYLWSGWQNITRYISNSVAELNREYYISIRNSEASDITPAVGSEALTITEVQDVTKSNYSALDSTLQRLVLGKSASFKVNDTAALGTVITSNRADFIYQGGTVGTDSFTRGWLETPIYLPAGTTVSVTNDWKFLLVKASTRYTTHKEFVPSSYTDEYVVEADDYYYIAFGASDDADIALTAQNITGDLTISLPASENTEAQIMYVSGAGNDSTGDGSKNNPYRQITKAISSGAKTIICDGGYKYNNISLSNVAGIRIIGSMPTYSTANKVQAKPYFDNGVELTGNTLESGKVKIPYVAEEGSDMYECLVSKTKALDDGSSVRSYGYYCTIFSEGDKDTSHRYIPVLTQDDVAGHFFYDGSNIFINPYEDNNESTTYELVDTSLEDQATLVKFNECHNISIENFIFKHSSSYSYRGIKSTGLSVKGCEFKGSSMSDNLAVVDSDVEVTECVSYLARNDGYNFHGFGNSTVTKCIGCNCFDDGISHHDKCTHVIIGGEYYRNHKGGISSPTYGCSGDIIGCYVHDNDTYGIMSSSDSTYGKSYVNLNGNLSVDNTIGIRLNEVTGIAVNNKVINNDTNIVNNSDVVIY